jgi:HEAT repeat protein
VVRSTGRRGLDGWLAAAAAAGLVLAGAGLVVLQLALDAAVDEVAATAAPGEDRVEALIRLASAEDAPLERRNRAVWALGQLRDERALPALARLDVEGACDHSRLVCQREVRKAMAKIRGELSLRSSLRTALHRLRERVG